MVRQYGFFFDAGLCSGCKACQLACKDKHNLNPGVLWRRVYEVSGGKWRREGGAWVPNVRAYNISLACNHCQEPICALSCPTQAIWKRADGIVFIESNLCIGCRYCEWACPYGAIRFDGRTNLASKCHFCFDLLGEGRPPACVAACPQRALDFGDLEELQKKYGGLDRIFPLPDPSPVKPALIIKPHKDAASAEAEKAEVANWEEL